MHALEAKWFILDSLFSWVLMLVFVACALGFLINVGRLVMAMGRGEGDAARNLFIPIVAWVFALMAASMLWQLL